MARDAVAASTLIDEGHLGAGVPRLAKPGLHGGSGEDVPHGDTTEFAALRQATERGSTAPWRIFAASAS